MKDYAFGNLVASLRTAQGYSQYQLGAMLGVSDKAISKWENGDAKPRLETCSHLAAILGISVNELLSAAARTKKETAEQEKTMMEEQKTSRMDRSKEKRVELHLCTGMSGKPCFGDIREYVKTAASWGHCALAVTDRFVTYSFPFFLKQARKSGIKPIMGCELRMVESSEERPDSGNSVIVLVRNRKGLVNLNRILSESYMKSSEKYYLYEDGIPVTVRSVLSEYREGLLFGSSCSGGEVVSALRENKPYDQLLSIAAFYDYIEVQPPECEFPEAQDIQKVQRTIREMVELGRKAGIPVAAVGNVQFPEPEESVLYDAFRYDNGETVFDRPAPFFFRTTNEMLKAFSFLDPSAARQIVITNTQNIAESISAEIDLLPPLPEGKKKFYPVLPDAENELTRIVYESAHAVYGAQLPVQVEERLKQELKIVCRKKYATLYLIARNIVHASLDAGHPVLGRGSMNGSLLTMLCGISKINPLPPHDRCHACGFTDFDIGSVSIRMAADLPEKVCPVCGKPLIRDGFGIPFASFLGENGEKEPDFDIVLTSEYRKTALKQAAGMFGKDHGLMPGIISRCYDDQELERMVLHYAENHQISVSDSLLDKLRNETFTIKGNFGHHAGGILFVPPEYEVCEFVPFSYLENYPRDGFLTTRYDWLSLEDKLLKVDLLQHRVLDIIKNIQEQTHINFDDIPLNDPNVLALFSSPAPLGVNSAESMNEFGTIGIPEFQTFEARKLLQILKPAAFSDLVAILGILHGTGVWENNGEELIRSGIATLSELPTNREDVMDTMIAHGMNGTAAFQTMESVRRGKGIPDEVIPLMKKAGISNWYINACQKIGYLFPRAHNVSYAVISVRMAWLKLYYPEAFYNSRLNIKRDDINYDRRLLHDPKSLRQDIVRFRRDKDFAVMNHEYEYEAEMILEAKLRGIKLIEIIEHDSFEDFINAL